MRTLAVPALIFAVFLTSCALEVFNPGVATAQFAIQEAPKHVRSVTLFAQYEDGSNKVVDLGLRESAFKGEFLVGTWLFEIQAEVPTGQLSDATKVALAPGEVTQLSLTPTHQNGFWMKAQELLDKGIRAFIQKPFQMADLARLLQQIMRRRAVPPEHRPTA